LGLTERQEKGSEIRLELPVNEVIKDELAAGRGEFWPKSKDEI